MNSKPQKRILKLLSTPKSNIQLTAVVGKDVSSTMHQLGKKGLVEKESMGYFTGWKLTDLGRGFVSVMSRMGEL